MIDRRPADDASSRTESARKAPAAHEPPPLPPPRRTAHLVADTRRRDRSIILSDEIPSDDIEGTASRDVPSPFADADGGDEARYDREEHEHDVEALALTLHRARMRRRLATGAALVGGAVAVFLLSRSPDRAPRLETPAAELAPPVAEPGPTPPPLAAEPGPVPTSATLTAPEEEAPVPAPAVDEPTAAPTDEEPGPLPSSQVSPEPIAALDEAPSAPAAAIDEAESEGAAPEIPAPTVVATPPAPTGQTATALAATAPSEEAKGETPPLPAPTTVVAATARPATPRTEVADGPALEPEKRVLTTTTAAAAPRTPTRASHTTNPTTGAEWYATGRRLAASSPRDALYAYRRAATRGYTVAYREIGRLEAARGRSGAAISAYRRYLRARPRAGDAARVRDAIARLGGR